MKKFLIASMLVIVLFVSACIGSNSTQGGQQAAGQQDTGQQAAGQQNAGQQGGQAVSTTVAQASGGGIVDRLSDIASAVTSGQAYTCTYTYEGVQSQILVKGQKFKVQLSTNQGLMNEISDGVWIYIWTQGESDGMKMKIQKAEATQPTGQNSGYTDVSSIQKSAVDVQCVPSTASDSSFNPPATVQFTDLSSLQQPPGAAGGAAGAGGDACSVCNMIPDAQQKQECLASCGGG